MQNFKPRKMQREPGANYLILQNWIKGVSVLILARKIVYETHFTSLTATPSIVQVLGKLTVTAFGYSLLIAALQTNEQTKRGNSFQGQIPKDFGIH